MKLWVLIELMKTEYGLRREDNAMRMIIVAMCMILSACVPMHTKQLYDSGVSYQDDGTVSVKRCDRMYVHSIHSLFQLQPFGANNFMDRNCHTLTGSIDDVNSSIKKYDAPSNELDKEFTAMKSSPYTGRGRSPGMFMGSYISAIEYDDNGKMYALDCVPIWGIFGTTIYAWKSTFGSNPHTYKCRMLYGDMETVNSNLPGDRRLSGLIVKKSTP